MVVVAELVVAAVAAAFVGTRQVDTFLAALVGLRTLVDICANELMRQSAQTLLAHLGRLADRGRTSNLPHTCTHRLCRTTVSTYLTSETGRIQARLTTTKTRLTSFGTGDLQRAALAGHVAEETKLELGRDGAVGVVVVLDEAVDVALHDEALVRRAVHVVRAEHGGADDVAGEVARVEDLLVAQLVRLVHVALAHRDVGGDAQEALTLSGDVGTELK